MMNTLPTAITSQIIWEGAPDKKAIQRPLKDARLCAIVFCCICLAVFAYNPWVACVVSIFGCFALSHLFNKAGEHYAKYKDVCYRYDGLTFTTLAADGSLVRSFVFDGHQPLIFRGCGCCIHVEWKPAMIRKGGVSVPGEGCLYLSRKQAESLLSVLENMYDRIKFAGHPKLKKRRKS